MAEKASSERIERFIEACEIEGREHALTSREYRISGGTRLSGGAGRYLYRFDQPKKLPLGPDSSITLAYADSTVEASFVRHSGASLVIALNQDCGPAIPGATLAVQSGDLPLLLARRLREAASGSSGLNTAMAERLFSHSSLNRDPAFAQLNAPEGLSAEQRAAVEGISTREISFLWGPPGTGKSAVLAATVHKFYSENRRVLLVTHTNQALDSVLEAVCQRISGRAKLSIPEGTILRIGPIVKESLADRFGAQIELTAVVQRGQQKTSERVASLRTEHSRLREQVSRLEGLSALVRSEQGLVEKLREAEANRRATQPGFFAALRRIFFGKGLVKTVVVDETVDLDGEISLLKNALDHVRKAIGSADRNAMEEDLSSGRERLPELGEALSGLEALLVEIERSTLSRARVVATTATRAMLRPEALAGFDAVVIDEASMLPMPMTYLLVGMARSQAVLAGDFRQLPPITLSSTPLVKECLGRDVFEFCGLVDLVDANEKHPCLFTLSTQFRCHEAIAKLFNGPFYGGALSTEFSAEPAQEFSDPLSIFNAMPVVVLDTSSLGAVGLTASKSKSNLVHALLVRSLVRALPERCPTLSTTEVGVIAPYRPQVDLIRELFIEEGIEGASVGTVHRFQGDERPVIVLDLTEAPPHRLGHFLGGSSLRDPGARLLNVALSRAKSRLFIVANMDHLRSQLNESHVLYGIIRDLETEGAVIDASVLSGLVSEQTADGADHPGVQTLTRALFLSTVFGDLRSARNDAVIASPRVAKSLVKVIGTLLSNRPDRLKVEIVVPQFSTDVSSSRDDYEQSLALLSGLGCRITTAAVQSGVVMIDDEICWTGTLDPLACLESETGTMTRCQSRVAASALRRGLPARDSVLEQQVVGSSN